MTLSLSKKVYLKKFIHSNFLSNQALRTPWRLTTENQKHDYNKFTHAFLHGKK